MIWWRGTRYKFDHLQLSPTLVSPIPVSLRFRVKVLPNSGGSRDQVRSLPWIRRCLPYLPPPQFPLRIKTLTNLLYLHIRLVFSLSAYPRHTCLPVLFKILFVSQLLFSLSSVGWPYTWLRSVSISHEALLSMNIHPCLHVCVFVCVYQWSFSSSIIPCQWRRAFIIFLFRCKFMFSSADKTIKTTLCVCLSDSIFQLKNYST